MFLNLIYLLRTSVLTFLSFAYIIQKNKTKIHNTNQVHVLCVISQIAYNAYATTNVQNSNIQLLFNEN
jgi:hypothetical protein